MQSAKPQPCTTRKTPFARQSNQDTMPKHKVVPIKKSFDCTKPANKKMQRQMEK